MTANVIIDKKQIETWIRDYRWMVREIVRLRQILEDAGDNLTQQYGVESSMPKPKGKVNDPIYMEAMRRERQWKRVERLEWKVGFVQEQMERITDERERTVLDCLLDGMSIAAVSRHMGISERNVYILRDRIVDKMMGNADFAGFTRNADNAGKMQVKSQCV